MTIYTVGDLIEALQKYDPKERIAIRAQAGNSQYFSVSEEVCQDGYLAPAPIYVYGHDADKPVYNVVFLGDNQESRSSYNRKIHRSRGDEITVEDVRTMIQRDPKPYVYTDPVTSKTSRLTEAEAEPWDSVVVFSPRQGYSQLIEHYGRKLMGDYTPTTEEVRAAYLAWSDGQDDSHPNKPAWSAEEFDRWLTAHDAEKRAEWEAEQG